METARRTTYFIRKGTLPAIAGNPADGSHPFGTKGMIVAGVMNVTLEPIAPRIPNRLSQNPAYRGAQIVHSDAPRHRAPPRGPNAGDSQEIRGPWLMQGIHSRAPYLCPFR